MRAFARSLRLASALAAFSAGALLGAGMAQAATFFKSPSGNIGCVIGERYGARCDIRERRWRPPPKPSSCPVDWGNGVQVGRRGRGSFTCAGDTVFGGKRTLGYGRSIRRGRFECFSRRTAMRCVNHRSRHGFSLSRKRARVF
jgi:hypothetical protein